MILYQLIIGLAITPLTTFVGWSLARGWLIWRWLHAEHRWEQDQWITEVESGKPHGAMRLVTPKPYIPLMFRAH